MEKVNYKYWVLVLVATFATFLFHEFGHWIVGGIYGYEVRMSLNNTWLVKGTYSSDFINNLSIAGGPFFTFLQVLLFYYIINKKEDNYYLLPFIFLPILMRFFTLGINLVNPQDEAQISINLGLGFWTIPALFNLVLLYFGFSVIRKTNLKLKFLSLNVLAAIFSIFLLILIDEKIRKVIESL